MRLFGHLVNRHAAAISWGICKTYIGRPSLLRQCWMAMCVLDCCVSHQAQKRCCCPWLLDKPEVLTCFLPCNVVSLCMGQSAPRNRGSHSHWGKQDQSMAQPHLHMTQTSKWFNNKIQIKTRRIQSQKQPQLNPDISETPPVPVTMSRGWRWGTWSCHHWNNSHCQLHTLPGHFKVSNTKQCAYSVKAVKSSLLSANAFWTVVQLPKPKKVSNSSSELNQLGICRDLLLHFSYNLSMNFAQTRSRGPDNQLVYSGEQIRQPHMVIWEIEN